MKTSGQAWRKLVRAARTAPAVEPAGAPFGFSTRVVARWLAGGRPQPSAWDLLSRRTLGVALIVMLLSVGVNYQTVTAQFAPEPATPVDLVELFTE